MDINLQLGRSWRQQQQQVRFLNELEDANDFSPTSGGRFRLGIQSNWAAHWIEFRKEVN